MNREDLDRELSRMIAAVKADAEPALLTRARARIEARAGRPALLAWAMRPAALGASFVLFVVSAGLSFALIANVPSEAGENGTLMESLLAERGIDDGSAALGTPAADTSSAPDSGGTP